MMRESLHLALVSLLSYPSLAWAMTQGLAGAGVHTLSLREWGGGLW